VREIYAGVVVQFRRADYRGYQIRVFGEGRSWSFSASPDKFDLPILRRAIFYCIATSAGVAMEAAIAEIDRLLDGLVRLRSQ
jgi:hypothetical protein